MQQTMTSDQSSTSSSQIQTSNDILSQTQLRVLERVMQISFQEALQKPAKSNGLPLPYRKLLTNLKMKKSKQTCTICLQNFVEGQIIKKLPCSHIMHRDCAKSWLKVNKHCPVCRLDLEEHFNHHNPTQTPITKPSPKIQEKHQKHSNKDLCMQKLLICT